MIQLKPYILEDPFCSDTYVVKVFDNESLIAQFHIESDYVKSDYYHLDNLIDDIGTMIFDMSHAIVDAEKIDELSKAK